MVLLDFGPEPDPPIAIRLVPHVHYTRRAARLLRFASRDFRGHAQHGLQRHAHLQRRRRRKKEPTARDVHRFRKVLTLVRGEVQRAETQWRADIVSCCLAAFGTHCVSLLPRQDGSRGFAGLRRGYNKGSKVTPRVKAQKPPVTVSTKSLVPPRSLLFPFAASPGTLQRMEFRCAIMQATSRGSGTRE